MLGQVQARMKPVYDVPRSGRVALGGAPIALVSSAVGALLRGATAGSSSLQVSNSVAHAGLAADGIARGLFYSSGLLHAVPAPRIPLLVVSRTPPAGFERFAGALGKTGSALRFGLLGIGGAMGALRAAQAVSQHGGGRALLETRDGRGGTLQAIGSMLLIVKHPATYLAGAAVFGLAAINELA